ncbi:MAG: hypothetical protein ACJ77K_05250 [Bacteroidia bacterium]
MFRNYLSFDLRAFALMRIGMASLLIADLCNRLPDLEAFYSNTGAVPLGMIFENSWNRYFISIHTISGLWQVQLLLFIFAFFCAIMLFIGYRTKLFTALSWFMLLSLHNRNGFILQGGDDLLRMVLFWAMFLPWGERYSYDGMRAWKRNQSNAWTGVAAFAYLLQICYLYTGSALLKGPEWNQHYTALYYTYSLDQIAYPITSYLYYHPDLLKFLTAVAYYFELLVPLLFFIPFKHSLFRTTGVIMILFFHLINLSTLFIGLFPLIGIVTALGILPAEAMNKLERLTRNFKFSIAISFRNYGNFVSKFISWKENKTRHPIVLRAQTGLLIFLTVFTFDWNFSNLSFTHSKLSDNLRFIGYSLRLDQAWGMFAPGVFKEDGWYILEAVDDSGKIFNLLEPDKQINYSKPKSIVSMFSSDRWRKYSENFIFSENEFMRGYFCSYYKRLWNEKHKNRHIHTLRAVYMEEMTLPDYKYSPPQKIVLWECVDE